MDVKEILNMTPESLAKEQHDILKQAAVNRLNEIISLIDEESYSKVESKLASSPAGDEMGCDNYYIDFSDIYGEDINDVIEKLVNLKYISK